jgi:hypothetical protein
MTGALGSAAFMSPLATIKVAIPGYVTAKLLARPASAKAVADYMKAYEMAAKAPTGKTADYLTRNAERLAIVAAQEAGDPSLAQGLVSKLVLQKAAATDEQNGVKRGDRPSQDQGAAEQENFNRAYLLGQGA